METKRKINDDTAASYKKLKNGEYNDIGGEYEESHAFLFDKLPVEIIFKIISSCNDTELIMLAKTCPRIELIVLDIIKDDDKFWEITCKCLAEIVKGYDNLSFQIITSDPIVENDVKIGTLYAKYKIINVDKENSKILKAFENNCFQLIDYYSFTNKNNIIEINCEELTVNDSIQYRCPKFFLFVALNFKKVKKLVCNNNKPRNNIFSLISYFTDLEYLELSVYYISFQFIKYNHVILHNCTINTTEVDKFNNNFTHAPTIKNLYVDYFKNLDTIKLCADNIENFSIRCFNVETRHFDVEFGEFEELANEKCFQIFDMFIDNSKNSITQIAIMTKPLKNGPDYLFLKFQNYLKKFSNLEFFNVLEIPGKYIKYSIKNIF